MSQPASMAFAFRSPWRCERNPMTEVPFFTFDLILGISVSGLAAVLFRSKTISEGRSSSGASTIFARVSGSFFTKATLMPSLRAVSLILAKKNRSSMKKRMRVGASSRIGGGGGSHVA